MWRRMSVNTCCMWLVAAITVAFLPRASPWGVGLKVSPNQPCRAPARNPMAMGSEFQEEERVRKMREMLNKQFSSAGRGVNPKAADEWCEPTNQLARGVVLVADPTPFQRGDPQSLARFAFSGAVPDVIPADRRAELMPVILLLEHGPSGSVGVMLNRRTGMLLGDLGDSPELRAFCIQPLWQGGIAGQLDLNFLHTYGAEIDDSEALTDDGLCLGGDFLSAVQHVTDGPGSTFNFRFVVKHTRWERGALEKEVAAGRWLPCKVGKMSIIKVRDRSGPDATRPMWTDLLHMAGGSYKEVAEKYYASGEA